MTMRLKKVLKIFIGNKYACMAMLLLLFNLQTFAQNVPISGTVADDKGNPIEGASISVKGATAGTATDKNGAFQINASTKSTLVISAVSFTTQEISLNGKTSVSITLLSADNTLEDVVIVGYGTQKKVNLTGSVSSVGADKIANRPVMNLTSTLAGAAAGVRITQGSGNPGSEGVSIRIRGTASFNNSAPLVLVDGVVADMVPINSDDVESISILKDAASAAIYGSRAANGVILVTTKKGKKNETPRVTFNALYAKEQAETDLKFMSKTGDWMELHNIAKLNANPTSTSPDYAYSTIADWRTADANPNGIYTNPITGQSIPNSLAYPNTDWAQFEFKFPPFSLHFSFCE